MLSKSEVRNLLRTVNPDNVGDVFEQFIEYAQTRNNYKLVDELLTEVPDYNWRELGESTQNLFKELSTPPPTPPVNTSTRADSTNALTTELKSAVSEHFQGKYLQLDMNGDTLLYEHEPATKTVKRIHKNADLAKTMTSSFVRWQEENSEPLQAGEGGTLVYQTDNHVKEAVNSCLLRVECLDKEPLVWDSDNSDVTTFGRLTVYPDNTVEFPYIKEFFEKWTDPVALAAFVWGIVSNLYKGRQAFYGVGKAETQKSLFFNTMFSEIFGNAFVSCTNASIKANGTFFLNFFRYAKLAMIPDCPNRRIIMSEWIKMLTGKDALPLEEKYESMASHVLEANVFILSNYEPEITSEKHATSRALIMELKGGKPEYVPDLREIIKNEIPGFLAWAEQCYHERSKDNYTIDTNDAAQKLVTEAAERGERDHIVIERRNFTVTKNREDFISEDDLKRAVREYGSKNSYTYENFINYLSYKHDISGELVGNQYIFRGLSASTSPAADFEEIKV